MSEGQRASYWRTTKRCLIQKLHQTFWTRLPIRMHSYCISALKVKSDVQYGYQYIDNFEQFRLHSLPFSGQRCHKGFLIHNLKHRLCHVD